MKRDWSDVLFGAFMAALLALVIALIVFVAIVVAGMDSRACADFANWSVDSLPARCLTYWMGAS